MPKKIQVSVCVSDHPRKAGGGCVGRGAYRVLEAFRREVETKGIEEAVLIVESPCQGFCHHGVTVRVQPGSALYGQVKETDVAEVLEAHLLLGCQVRRLLLARNRFFPGF